MSLTPISIRGLVGGLTLTVPVGALLTLTGNVFGVAGFIHGSFRSWKGSKAPWHNVLGFAGLVAGGAAISVLESGRLAVASTSYLLPTTSWARIILSGALVGLGSKLQNGCTSGHMICGISRFSPRSLTATGVFALVAAATTHIVHRSHLPVVGPSDWTLGALGLPLLLLQLFPLTIEAGLFALKGESTTRRLLTSFVTAIHFAFALQLGGLTDPQRVVSFLVLPLPYFELFDPTLFWLAIGALPTSAILYRIASNTLTAKPEPVVSTQPNETTPLKATSKPQPLLGGSWSVPQNEWQIDKRLLIGAAVFGVGWGLEGICPGPAVINFGRTLAAGNVENFLKIGGWLTSFVLAGLLA